MSSTTCMCIITTFRYYICGPQPFLSHGPVQCENIFFMDWLVVLTEHAKNWMWKTRFFFLNIPKAAGLLMHSALLFLLTASEHNILLCTSCDLLVVVCLCPTVVSEHHSHVVVSPGADVDQDAGGTRGAETKQKFFSGQVGFTSRTWDHLHFWWSQGCSLWQEVEAHQRSRLKVTTYV